MTIGVNEIFYTSKRMVWLYEISRESLRKWREKGLPYNENKKLYPLGACHKWIVENILRPKSENGDINKEKLLRERAKRIQDEFKAEAMKENLIPKGKAEQWLHGHVEEAKTALWGLPRRMGPVLMSISDEKEIELLLREEIHKILEEMAKPLHGKKQSRRKNSRKSKILVATA